MERCRVESETTAHLDQQAVLESQPHMVRCLECKETKLAEEMHHIMEYFDSEGCCDDCAVKEDVIIEWGF